MSNKEEKKLNISEPSPRSEGVLTRLKTGVLDKIKGPKEAPPPIGGYYSLSSADTKDIANRAAFNLVQALDQIEGGVKGAVKVNAINQLDKALKAISDNIENLDIQVAGRLNDFFREFENNTIVNHVLKAMPKGSASDISRNLNVVEKNCKERLYPEALEFAKFQVEFNQTFLDSTRLPKGNIEEERSLLKTVLEDLEKNTNIPKSDVGAWKKLSQQTHKEIQTIFNAIHEKIEAIAKSKFSTSLYNLARNNGEVTYTRREASAGPKKFMMDALDPLKKIKERISAQVQPKSDSKPQKN